MSEQQPYRMLVRATRVGFDGVKRRREGEQFILTEDQFKYVKNKKGEETSEVMLDAETGFPVLPDWVELIDANAQPEETVKKKVRAAPEKPTQSLSKAASPAPQGHPAQAKQTAKPKPAAPAPARAADEDVI